MKNLVVAIFRLKHSQSADDILTVMQHFIEWVTTPDQESLCHSLAVWLTEIPLKKLTPGYRIIDFAGDTHHVSGNHRILNSAMEA